MHKQIVMRCKKCHKTFSALITTASHKNRELFEKPEHIKLEKTCPNCGSTETEEAHPPGR